MPVDVGVQNYGHLEENNTHKVNETHDKLHACLTEWTKRPLGCGVMGLGFRVSRPGVFFSLLVVGLCTEPADGARANLSLDRNWAMIVD